MGFDRLIENIVRTQNPSVVGLDPKLEYVPEFIRQKNFKKYGKDLKGAAKSILEFNKEIIDEIHDICLLSSRRLLTMRCTAIMALKRFTRLSSMHRARVCSL